MLTLSAKRKAYFCGMEFIRDSRFSRFLIRFLAFLIFNYSVDTPDPFSDNVREDLSYNDMESFTELLLEKVIGWENAVPETDDDDPDDKSGGFTKKISTPLLKKITIETPVFAFSETRVHHYNYRLPEHQAPLIDGLVDPPEA